MKIRIIKTCNFGLDMAESKKRIGFPCKSKNKSNGEEMGFEKLAR